MSQTRIIIIFIFSLILPISFGCAKIDIYKNNIAFYQDEVLDYEISATAEYMEMTKAHLENVRATKDRKAIRSAKIMHETAVAKHKYAVAEKDSRAFYRMFKRKSEQEKAAKRQSASRPEPRTEQQPADAVMEKQLQN